MANFVLVHGAWHGGWCWQRVTKALQQDGHRVHAVTLTGLGERAHLLSPAITLDTHIDDVLGLIEAEELQITAQNVTQQAQSKDPNVRRFLGVDGDLGKGLGLANDFAARAIKQVGNYGELYDRNLGAKTKLNLPRGQNQLWNRGGLLFSPPFR